MEKQSKSGINNCDLYYSVIILFSILSEEEFKKESLTEVINDIKTSKLPVKIYSYYYSNLDDV